MTDAMLSVIFASRVQGNPASNVARLLHSAVATIDPADHRRIEFLIKYDDDDTLRPSNEALAGFPFDVRTFVYSRGEGRSELHHFQEYLFAQHNPAARFCMFAADDFHFTRSGFLSDILAVEEPFAIISDTMPPLAFWAENDHYKTHDAMCGWPSAAGNLAPVLSVRLIEVCQNLGWQTNIDSWLLALSFTLWGEYGIDLWQIVPAYYLRNGPTPPGAPAWDRIANLDNGLDRQPSPRWEQYQMNERIPSYNNMEVSCHQQATNAYWFDLLRQQARNIALNMREDAR